ncbi:MAG: hypothetical protein ABTR07_09105 [Candidatus Competibacter denitrificans]
MKRWLFIFATVMAVLWLVPDAEARGRGGRGGGGGRAAAAMVGVAVGAAAAMLAPRNPPPPRPTVSPRHSMRAPLPALAGEAPVAEQPAPAPTPEPTPQPVKEAMPPPPAQVAKPFNCTPIGWCYTVYNPDGSVAESGANPPKIDLSYPPREGAARPHIVISNYGESASGGYVDYGSSGGYADYGSSGSGGRVFVRSYTRSDGTNVRSHYRSAPRR